MPLLTSFLRVIRLAGQNFWRNLWLSVVTVTIMVLTLLSISVLSLFSALSGNTVAVVAEKADLSVALKPEVAPEEAERVAQEVRQWPEVRQVTVVSAADALERFRQKHQGNPVILESLQELGANPLGASLLVKSTEPQAYYVVLQRLAAPPYLGLIQAQEEDFRDYDLLRQRIDQLSQQVRRVGSGFIAVFALIAALVILNTIRVAIYTHREEIGIMKLVGASNAFIRSPFIVESVIYATASVAVLLLLLYPSLHFLQPTIDRFFGEYSLPLVPYLNSHFASLIGTQYLLALGLNVVGSSIAVSRYLKV